MPKHQKAIDRLCAVPPPADFTWQELTTVLEHLGYRQLKTGKSGGSRRKFFHAEKDALICCHKPHPSPEVDKGCIVDVVEHLKSHGLI